MAKSATTKNPAIRRRSVESDRFANNVVSIEKAPPASRIVFQGTKAGVKSFEKALGFALPAKPGAVTKKAGKHALWIGPNEWLLIDDKSADTSMVPRLANKGFSAVDISHRNMAFIVSGPGAENTLNVACPRDLSTAAFPVNTCSRTVFGKAEIVLYRTAKDTFRIECWRSFGPYVWTCLCEGAKDAHV